MLDFSRVVKECFWDTNISQLEIEAIISGDDFRKKQFLFEKILLNSTKLFYDLSLFNKTTIKELLSCMHVPRFNGTYIARRKNLAEVYFLNYELKIDELKWVS